MRRATFVAATASLAAMSLRTSQAQSNLATMTTVSDLRFGYAPLPPATPGFDPAGDAKALIAPGTPSPASGPIAGAQLLGAIGPSERYVLRVPQGWNGKLVVAGTPATRSEFANDAIWSDYALSLGYAFASGNKGIPYNAIVEAASGAASLAYPVPFDAGGLERDGMVFRLGALEPRRVPIEEWNASFVRLFDRVRADLGLHFGRLPVRTYAVGISNGGAQVRWLLENHPELIDGGIEWSAVYWSREQNFLGYLPAFLRAMPDYVRSGYNDRASRDAILEAGFPPDRQQNDPAHPSLWLEYYSNVAPFYADVSVFLYGLLIDPHATSRFGPCRPDASEPARLPGHCEGGGLALPANRARYAPSSDAKKAFDRFAHSGHIGRPLVAIAGLADAFITPQRNAVAYLDAVVGAGAGNAYRLYLVEGGTHVDPFVSFGYGLRAQLPFAWAAFDQLVRIVERGAQPSGTGTAQRVTDPADIVAFG